MQSFQLSMFPYFDLGIPFCFLYTSLGLEIKATQINSMRVAISETFPEPNRRLLQRFVFLFGHRNIFCAWISLTQ
jgi:hypothetical protein